MYRAVECFRGGANSWIVYGNLMGAAFNLDDHRPVLCSIAADMKLIDGDHLNVRDSLTLIELVAALEDATGRDLLAMPLTLEHFRTVQSICELLGRAAEA